MKETIKIKSVPSRNLIKSVVQTSYDIVKVHGIERADKEAGRGAELLIVLQVQV